MVQSSDPFSTIRPFATILHSLPFVVSLIQIVSLAKRTSLRCFQKAYFLKLLDCILFISLEMLLLSSLLTSNLVVLQAFPFTWVCVLCLFFPVTKFLSSGSSLSFATSLLGIQSLVIFVNGQQLSIASSTGSFAPKNIVTFAATKATLM